MPTQDYSFPKRNRLCKRKDFKATERKQFKAYGRYLIAYVVENHGETTRLGITATKKIGSAPRRNWWKRRLREIFRHHKDLSPTPIDIVLIVRFQATQDLPSYSSLEQDLLGTVARAIATMKEAQ